MAESKFASMGLSFAEFLAMRNSVMVRPKWRWWKDPRVRAGIQTDSANVVYVEGDYFQLRVSPPEPLVRLIFSFLGDRDRVIASTVSKALNGTPALAEVRLRLRRERLKKNSWWRWVPSPAYAETPFPLPVFCWYCSKVTAPICTFCGEECALGGGDDGSWQVDWDHQLLACTRECATRLGRIPREDLPVGPKGSRISFRMFSNAVAQLCYDPVHGRNLPAPRDLIRGPPSDFRRWIGPGG